MAASSSALPLLRRWVLDYFNSHDDAAAREFIAPEYELRIGDVVFRGRDDNWLPAVAAQMRLFPGLGMTVHQTLAGEDWAAVCFSQHGASRGRIAVWSGVAIYESDGEKLTGCVAQEDYMTRQRQLKGGLPDLVESPAAAPWDIELLPRDAAAEEIVRRWLDGSWPMPASSVRCDDEHITQTSLRFDVAETEIDTLKSSGQHVVFHARQSGRYIGGLPGVEREGTPAVLQVNGIVRVADCSVVEGRVIRDRAGLRAALLRSEAA